MSPTHVAYIEQRGRRILRVDYSGLGGDASLAARDQTLQVLRGEPERSVLMLSVANAAFNGRIVQAIKGYAAAAAPYLRAWAVLGADSFHRLLIGSLQLEAFDRLEAFDDEEQAKDWLASHF